MNTRTLYFIKHFALLALFAIGLMLVPNAGSVSAQKRADREVATTEMLSYALNLKSLSQVAVYGETVSDKGASTISNGFSKAGPDGDGVTRRDLENVFSAMNQLPCSKIEGTDLSGTFAPGVYCLSSADVTSRLVMDAQNNPGAVFVFRTTGGFSAKSGAIIGLENGAMAANVFFVSDDTATIGEGVDFKGNIIARNRIGVGADAMVDGRVISAKGEVALSGNSVLGPQQTGVLEICKAIDSSAGGNLTNRIFQFQLNGPTGPVYEVPAGQCSAPIFAPAGNNTVTELQSGRVTDGGTFVGNFQLTDVRQLNVPAISPNPVVSTNLPGFSAVINVRAGDIPNQTRIQFTNRFAITAIVEICKEALDSGVTGFFNFTINELRDAAGVLIPFTVPVGQCTGPIAVVVSANSTDVPRTGTVTVNELPRTGFIFTSATTAVGTSAPTNRLVGFNVLANGGGNATVTVVAGSNGGIDTTGATAVQTTVFFNNRTAPATLKICKIAGPGIPELTPFTFTVNGTGPLAPVTAPTTVPVGGTAATGATLQGGVATTQTVTVLAGPAGNGAILAGNGFCQVAAGTFVVDTTATITETGPLTIGSSDVRVVRIASSSGIVAATATPNAPPFGAPGGTPVGGTPFTLTTQPFTAFYPASTGAATTRTVTVPIVREVTEVEYVNIAFAPAPLKVCKVAGTGVAVGTPFTFTTVPSRLAGNLLPAFTTTQVITAGPAATGPGTQNGFCDFVNGPFTGTFGGVAGGAVINGLGSFNVGSTVVVTETPQTTGGPNGTGYSVTSITSPTATVVGVNATGVATIPTIINGVNEIQFVNVANPAVIPPALINPKSRKRARFF